MRYLASETPHKTIVDGHTFFLDKKDSLGLSLRGVYEPAETQLFKRILRPGDVVIDIGAHIGYYTLIAARIVGPDGRVYAFEPDPENFLLLEKNVSANGYRNVATIMKAVSGETGSATLYFSPRNTGDHRIYDPCDNRADSIEVETVALDDYFTGYGGKINFIKMDIEGAEAKALKGMKGLFLAHPEAKLLTEFVPKFISLSGESPEAYFRALTALGFHIYGIEEKTGRAEELPMEELLKTFSAHGRNLFCRRGQI